MKIIFAAVLPVILYIIASATGKQFLGKKKIKRGNSKKFFDAILKIGIAEFCFFFILYAVSEYMTYNDGKGIPFVISAIAGILPFSAVFTRTFLPEKKIASFLKKASIAVAVIFAAEVLIFNGKSLTSLQKDEKIDLNSVSISGNARLEDGDICIYDATSVTINNVFDETQALTIDIERDSEDVALPFFLALAMTDGSSESAFQTTNQKYISSQNSEVMFTFKPYKNVNSLQLNFSEVENPVVIHSIRTSTAAPFRFSCIRFLVLSAIVLLIIAVLEFRLYSVTYNRKKLPHIIIAQAMAIICTVTAFAFVRPGEEPVAYDENYYASPYDPYAATLDAFNKGQVYLDIEAEAALENLDNVYDRNERDASEIFYYWDTAYYEGKYYCYFGVAPVVAYYAPYLALTGKMPTKAMALGFFGIIAVFALCQTILAAVKLLVPRPNFLLMLSMMPAAVGCCLYYTMNTANKYNVPQASALCFIFITLWLGFSAYSCKKKVPRLIMLVISGASLAFCVASRPGVALTSALLIPFFLGILKDKKMSFSYRLSQAACFVVPLLAGGIAVMWYNNARFDSPFDFGSAYQLTVSDVSANKLAFSGIPPMIYHYFIQHPRPRGSFPFFEFQFCPLYNYQKYVYVDEICGIFNYPMLLFGTLLFPFSLQRKGRHFSYSASKLQRNTFIILCFALAFFVGWQDYCLGGAIHRYVIDIMPVMCLGAVICILRAVGKPEKHPQRHIFAYICITATFAMNWLLMVGQRDCNLIYRSPDIYDKMNDLLIFWQ